MTCKCADYIFSYTFYDFFGIYKIEKCGRLSVENRKKNPCDFYKKTLIKSKKDSEEIEIKKTHTNSQKRDYKRELYNFINMCEKFGPNENYMGNMVYLMKICGYTYIPHENLSALKKRLASPPIKKYSIKSNFPLCLIEIPDDFKIKIKKMKSKKITYDIISDDDSDSESKNTDDDDFYNLDIEETISDEEINDNCSMDFSLD